LIVSPPGLVASSSKRRSGSNGSWMVCWMARWLRGRGERRCVFPAPRRIGLDHRQDGLILGLLSAEITARTGRDPSTSYDGLTQELGEPFYERIDAAATQEQKKILSTASAEQSASTNSRGKP